MPGQPGFLRQAEGRVRGGVSKAKSPGVKRYQPGRWIESGTPSGHFALGLPKDEAQALGNFVVAFAHLEQAMADFFACLINDPAGEIAGPVWASQNSNRARHRLMKTVLEEHRLAKDIDSEADHLLSQFSRLIDRRNEYIHGLWQTEIDKDQIYLTPRIRANGDHWDFQPVREVAHAEIAKAVGEIDTLHFSARRWRNRWLSDKSVEIADLD